MASLITAFFRFPPVSRTAGILFFTLCAFPSLLTANQARDNWNQWGLPDRDGIRGGHAKLAFLSVWDQADPGNQWGLGGEFEVLLTDHFGVTGSVALPFSRQDTLANLLALPFDLGGRIHFAPGEAWEPLYIGGRAGFTYFRPGGPLASGGKTLPDYFGHHLDINLGTSLYFWGSWYLELEGGLRFLQYAQTEGFYDLNGTGLRVKAGVYF